MSYLIFCVWMGGVYPAYILERASGATRLSSILDSVFWPFGLGRFLVERFYITDNFSSAESMTRKGVCTYLDVVSHKVRKEGADND